MDSVVTWMAISESRGGMVVVAYMYVSSLGHFSHMAERPKRTFVSGLAFVNRYVLIRT